MRYLPLFVFFVIISSCSGKKQKNVNDLKSTKDEPIFKEELNDIKIVKDDLILTAKTVFFRKDKINVFDFSKSPLLEDYKKMSNISTEKYNVSKRTRQIILKDENYYKLFKYNKLDAVDGISVSAIFGNYDYYTNILLVTRDIEKDSIIDIKIIASIMGDADYTEEISSKILNSDSIEVVTKKKKLIENGHFDLLDSKKEIFVISKEGTIISDSTRSR